MMSEQTEMTATASKVIQIGPDKVTIKHREVIIEAKHRMPEWQVRELNPPPVYFQDSKYHVVEASKAEAPYAVRYLLMPWPADLSSNSKLFYNYDIEAVNERESNLRGGQMDEVLRGCLMPFYPLLGLLWSKTQTRLTRFGFVPHAITGISVFVVFCLTFAQGVFATVTINASLRSGKVIVGGMLRALANHDNLQIGPIAIPIALLDGLLTVAFLADVAIRYSLHLREHDWAGGFLEWLFRRENPAAEKEAA
ncbi:MAG TPA: hypothetical protein VLT36_01235 [Candidatus Dormibacteraeota bacterium]|nr:hypothetical protein [Candidatus Dormibacteraeota bacterium]